MIRPTPVAALLVLSLLSLSSAVVPAVAAAEAGARERPIDGIMDNSFLVEEAYNQEPGIVQHIATANYSVFRGGGEDSAVWQLAFTQEWPLVSQRHQLSYTVPYFFADSHGTARNGVGDVFLNYRFQALYDEERLLALAPRASLVLPTGDSRLGFSDDSVGAQFNVPFSVAWGDRWFTHFNAGLTYLPDALLTDRQDALHYSLGASVIYAATRDLHFMLEGTGTWLNTAGASGGLKHEFVPVLAPGLRKAFNFAGDTQLVLGVASPIGLNANAPDFGVFLYLSFEHRFRKDRSAPDSP